MTDDKPASGPASSFGGATPSGGSEFAARRGRVGRVFASSGFRRLFLARTVSQLGDGVFQLAAASVLLFEHPGPNPVVDLLVVSSVTLIPFSAVGPFVGVFIDRWNRRKILARVPLMRAGVAALAPASAYAFGTRSLAFYTVVLIVLSSNRFFLATMSAVLPSLVPEGDLLMANSIASTGGSVASVAGQGIGAAVAAWLGGTRGGIVAAAAFVAGAIAARRIPISHEPRARDHAPLGAQLGAVASEMSDGMRAIRRAPRVVYALTSIGVVQLLVGAMVGVLIHYFIAELGLKVGAATAILAVLALGIGAGVVGVPLAARRLRHDVLVVVSLGIASVGTLVSAAALSRVTLISAAGIVGLAYAFAKIPVDTIVQEEMSDAVRGRAFALYDMLFNVARVAGVAVVALAYQTHVSSRTIVGIIGACYALAAVVFGLWERRRHAAQQAARGGA